MDSDLQHDPAMLPALIHAVEDGADLAIGSRYVPGGARPGLEVVAPVHLPGRQHLRGHGARPARARPHRRASGPTRPRAIEQIDLDHVKADGYGFQIEMAYAVANNGGRIVEVPITFGNRERGASKMSSIIVFEALGLVTWWGIRDRVLHRHQVRPTTRLAAGRG